MQRPRFLLAGLVVAGVMGAVMVMLMSSEHLEENIDDESRPQVRPPAVEGAFYPSDSSELAGMVSGFLEQAEKDGEAGELVALIVPHAGYVFSGAVAGEAYRQIAGRRYDTVAVVGPSHREAFRGFALSGADEWETPLGKARLDTDARDELMSLQAGFQVRDSAHAREHSIETQVPFLQKTLPEARLLPILMFDSLLPVATVLGEVLADYARERSVLLIASTDMSHYPSYEDAVRVDGKVLEAITRMDAAALEAKTEKMMLEDVAGLKTCLCGEGPVKAVLVAAGALGAQEARVLRYANSGDVPGAPKDRVVGYCAVAIYRSSGAVEEG